MLKLKLFLCYFWEYCVWFSIIFEFLKLVINSIPNMQRFFLFILVLFAATNGFAQVEFSPKFKPIAPKKTKPIQENEAPLPVTPFNLPKIVTPNIFKETSIFGIKPKTNNSFPIGVPEIRFSLTPPTNFEHKLGDVFQNKMTKDLDKTLVREGLKEDTSLLDRANRYLGDFKTKSNYLVVQYRDFIQIDGDLFNVYVNDQLVQSQLFLDFQFSEFKIPLSAGINKVEFVVASQGTYGGNTAEIHVFDDANKSITDEYWNNLALGTKIKLIVIKE